MIRTFSIFWSLCFFQAKPDDIPYSKSLMVFVITIYLMLSMPFLLIDTEFTSAIILNFTSFFLTTFLWYAILSYRKVTERLIQSVTALFGCWTIQLSMLVPVMTISMSIDASGQLANLSYYAIIIWSLAITARILQYTTSISFNIGFLLATVMMLLDIYFMQLLTS